MVDLNTSHVKVKPNVLIHFIVLNLDLNTSHVKVKPTVLSHSLFIIHLLSQDIHPFS